MSSLAHGSRLGLVVLLAASTFGCGALRRMAGNDIVVLEKADVRAMAVDIRKPSKTICPREDVQMVVMADVVLDGETGVKRVETYVGRGSVDKNDKMDFAEFAFSSPNGRFDEQGWFIPDPNLLATAGTPFQIHATYKRRPAKLDATMTYRPDYTCIKAAGSPGAKGNPGADGQPGREGADGTSGSATAAGSVGADGAPGTPGGNGTPGARGPNVQAFVSMVKTPFYDRLVGIVLTGDVTDFVLVPEGQPIVLTARGGDGGDGGKGGQGGQGGRGGRGNPGGAGGNGGPGGAGGVGGAGGEGGTIDLMIDSRFPALSSQITIDVNGGEGGAAGAAGPGGPGGGGGAGEDTPNGPARQGASGSSGPSGSAGAAGPKGSPGRQYVNKGNVSDMFQNRGNVTPL